MLNQEPLVDPIAGKLLREGRAILLDTKVVVARSQELATRSHELLRGLRTDKVPTPDNPGPSQATVDWLPGHKGFIRAFGHLLDARARSNGGAKW